MSTASRPEEDDVTPGQLPIQVCKGCNGLGEQLVVFATARGGFVPACRSCAVCDGRGRTVLHPPV
ncbi:conserved hypothetical protein [Frankia canadensis]|uniref:Uncharacterized protein n=1 Tax=Frankia canadensis TaxID=1836972 RepID=A0A2I2KTU2_9ACTN|nr:hypothetical protein [Frankia canadensis]SNQ49075.1 conserved hypothetical protein [Frankia canadensis]SOU56365.1 conserved hypothetical protein [Frankia canadensis]